jgi:hypothetical protein
MPLVVIDGPTIAANESLSDGVDCSAGMIVRITVPQEYDNGDTDKMSFQVSSDGVGYNDLVDDTGKEITITAHPNTGIVIDRSWARTVGWIKLRSGMRDRPSKQKVDCKLAIAVLASEPAAAGTRR